MVANFSCTSTNPDERESEDVSGTVVKIGWSESGKFHSDARSLIQLFNDFEKPLTFYPVIDSSEAEYREDDLFYRNDISTPYSGKVLYRSDEGQILSESIFLNGVPHGPQRAYYPNEQKSMESIYDHGVMIGIQTKWWRDGKIKEEVYWSGGKCYGSKSWDNSGRLIRQIRIQ